MAAQSTSPTFASPQELARRGRLEESTGMQPERANRQLWYVRREGQMRGPLPEGQVSREIILGRILLSDEVSDDRRRWHALATIPKLVPEVVHHANTEAGRSRLLLARLREDERLHDRRAPHPVSRVDDRRHGDRRNFGSLETFMIPEPVNAEEVATAKQSQLLLPLAILMVLLFALGFYLFR
jgi:hypothetical protein